MATQAVMFANTIASMKKAVKRKAYDSDSGSSIDEPTNRGNKLRKRARFVREGQLAPPTGPLVYRKRIEHAGFHRDVISRNPPVVDEDGYEFDSEDDDEQVEEALAAAAEMNPYSNVQIEELLAPLTSAADLPDHPTLSRPFTSKTLTELTRQAGEMVHKEKESLWKIKHLLTKMSGDDTWIPCGIMETETDFELFIDERDHQRAQLLSKGALRNEREHGSTPTLVSDAKDQPMGLLTAEAHISNGPTSAGTSQIVQIIVQETDNATEASVIIPVESIDKASAPGAEKTARSPTNGTAKEEDSGAEPQTNGEMEIDDGQKLDEQPQATDGETADDDSGLPVPRRMRTRAQAQAASDSTPMRTRSATPDSTDESYIHPYFIAARASRPDRDLHLPANEADETRRLLQLYIQKQEEVCRGAQKVYEGLLKAERVRHEVMKWCKAEAHVGTNRDMSDGEDWYDKEEWGLDEDLKKGQDEEEEDATTTAKKTRARRQ